MKRADIEQYMKENKLIQIDLIIKETDELGIYCRIKNGKLYDYTDHVIDRKITIWGYLKWENGRATRVAW